MNHALKIPEKLNARSFEVWREIDPDNWVLHVSELVRIFLKSAPDGFDRLKAAHVTGDRSLVSREAHTLKSSCGMLGADFVKDLFAELEAVAEIENEDELAKRIKNLQPAFEEAMALVGGIGQSQAA